MEHFGGLRGVGALGWQNWKQASEVGTDPKLKVLER